MLNLFWKLLIFFSKLLLCYDLRDIESAVSLHLLCNLSCNTAKLAVSLLELREGNVY